MEFNFTKHWSGIFFGQIKLETLFNYCQSSEAHDAFFKSMKWNEFSDEEGLREIEVPSMVIDAMKTEISDALDVVLNQMLVYMYSRYEIIIEDFVNCLFVNNIDKMKKLIEVYKEYENSLGFSFNEFILTSSKEDYINTLSSRISKRLISNKPEKVFTRLKCICTLIVSTNEIATLNELMVRRNFVVHEGKLYDLKIEDINRYHATLDSLLVSITRSLKREGVQIIDDGDLLEKQDINITQ